MPARTLRRWGTAALLIVVTSLGCDSGVHGNFLPNQAPEVQITRTSRETATDGTVSYRIFWQGQDADGAVDHYLVAIDPPSVDGLAGAWISVKETSYKVSLAPTASAHELHVFAVRAVDSRGAISRAAWFAYSTENVPP